MTTPIPFELLTVAGLNLVSRGQVPGQKIVNRYGRNFDVDAAEDIWPGGGDYPGFPATADQFEIFSSSAADTAAGTGARTVRFYYLDANLNAFDASDNFLFADVTLNGVTPVPTGITGKRIWGVFVLTAGSGQTNAGTIIMRHIATPTTIFCNFPAGFSRCMSSVFTVPLGWSAWMMDYGASMQDNTTNQSVIAIKSISGGVVMISRPFAIAAPGSAIDLSPAGGIAFGPLTDIVMRSLSVQSANGDVSADYSLLLVKN